MGQSRSEWWSTINYFWKIISSPVVKLGLDYFPPLFLCLFMNQFIIHDWDHLMRFLVAWKPPILLSTITSLLDRFSFISLIFFVFLDAYISMDPVDFILFAFVGISTMLVGVSFSVEGFLINTHIFPQVSVLFFVMLDLGLQFLNLFGDCVR